MKLKKILNQLNIWSVQAEAWMQVCHAAMDRFPELFLPVTSDPTAKHSAEVIIGLLDELYDRRRSDEAMRDFVTGLLPKGRSLGKSELFTDMLKRYASQPPPSDLATELMAEFMETGAKQHEQVFGTSPAVAYVMSYCETHRVNYPANAECPLCATFKIPFLTQKADSDTTTPKTKPDTYDEAVREWAAGLKPPTFYGKAMPYAVLCDCGVILHVPPKASLTGTEVSRHYATCRKQEDAEAASDPAPDMGGPPNYLPCPICDGWSGCKHSRSEREAAWYAAQQKSNNYPVEDNIANTPTIQILAWRDGLKKDPTTGKPVCDCGIVLDGSTATTFEYVQFLKGHYNHRRP